MYVFPLARVFHLLYIFPTSQFAVKLHKHLLITSCLQQPTLSRVYRSTHMRKSCIQNATGPTSMVLTATSLLPHPSFFSDSCAYNVVTTWSFIPPHLVTWYGKRSNNTFPLEGDLSLEPQPRTNPLLQIFGYWTGPRPLYFDISLSHALILLGLASDFFLFPFICVWDVCEAFPGFSWGFWKEWCLVCYREFWMTALLLRSQECWAQHNRMISTCYIGIRYHCQDPFPLLSLRYHLQDRQRLQEESDQPWGRYLIQSQVLASPKPSWSRFVRQYK